MSDHKKVLKGKRVLVTGGTGTIGKVLVRRLLSGEMGLPEKVIVFSRDEAKQHFMRVEYQKRPAATDEIIYHNFERRLEFRIGDVRDYHQLVAVLRDVDVVVNAAAMKQVPTCEYFPYEAVRTNIDGAENIVRAIQEHDLKVETVVGVSTDKACKPVNIMGMTKAVQERIFIQANMRCRDTRFVCVRYGNVLASRGSVIPLFIEQVRLGGPVTVTTLDMTRFLLSLEEAVDTVFAAISEAKRGETYVPRAPAARMIDVATALIGDRKLKTVVTGIRPGEKIHEIMVSEEEAFRTVERGKWYAILPMLPEICGDQVGSGCLTSEYSSHEHVMTYDETVTMLKYRRLMPEDVLVAGGELVA
ncbi:MAG: polysaccharide biosynthesis protein [Gemmatimonadaceae bacterium]|nr:polysaccharide biosynthesis protein [Gemmatimonadaceae bacterium]MBA3656833.1 polysaccharide biosynthesis protein [Gemmatimonadaceae bacterium]